MRRLTAHLLILAASAALLLAPALLTSKVLLPADLMTRYFPWSQVAEPRAVNNTIQTDVLEQAYPYHVFLREQAAQGRLPLWNPHSQTGTPFLATSVSAALNPFQWLLMLLPLRLYFEWAAWLKLFLAGSGIYLLGRRIGLDPSCSLAAALIYQLSGYQIFYLGYSNTWISALFGWTLLTLERYFQGRRPSDLAAFASLMALGYLGGQMECALLLQLSAGLYALARAPRRIAPVVLCGALGFAAAAAAVLPFADFILGSATLGLRAEIAEAPHLSWTQWASLFDPYYQNPGLEWQTDRFSILYFAYLGVLPTFLALLARPLAAPCWRALTALGGFSLAILWGIWPIFDLFIWPPILRSGNHIHIAFALEGAAALLAGFGLQRIARGEASRRRLAVALGLSIAAVALPLPAAYLRWSLGQIEEFFFVNWHLPLPLFPLWTAAALAAAWRLRLHSRAVEGFTALLVANSFLAGSFYNTAVEPLGTISLRPPPVRELAEHPHERMAAVGVGSFPPNLSMVYGIRDVRGYESVALPRVGRYMEAIAKPGDLHFWITELDARGLRVLKRAGCRYVLSPRPLNLTDLQPVDVEGGYLYRIPGASRARVASEIVVVDSPREALRRTQGPAFFGAAVLEGVKGEQIASPGRVRWVSDQPDRVELDVDMNGPGWLILHDAYAPGWEAFVDGGPVEIARADYLFRGVPVPRGRSRVSFIYRPWSFRWGVGISAVAWLAIGAVALGGRFTRSREDAES